MNWHSCQKLKGSFFLEEKQDFLPKEDQEFLDQISKAIERKQLAAN
jgi:hypothetical protein